MVSRITAALAARYKAIQEKEKGFTLIELLVVVIIIGVLAAIAIPIYIGVQNSAKDSAVQSDLTNAKIAVVAFYTEENRMPVLGTDAAAGDMPALKNYGLTKSDNTAGLRIAGATMDVLCIEARRGDLPDTDVKAFFKITSDKGAEAGKCATS